MSQAANDTPTQAMTQEQRTIVQQAHQIAALSAMLENAVNRANQLGRLAQTQATALEQANKKIAELEGKLTPVAAAAKARRRTKA